MSIDKGEWIRLLEDCRFYSRVERTEKELKETLEAMIKEPHNPISSLFEGIFLSSKGENTMDKKPKFKVGDKIIGNKKANKYNYTKEGWIGTVVTVYDKLTCLGSDIEAKGDNCEIYPIKSDCFDLYKPAPNYKAVITSDGKTTTARYYENEKKVSEAKSVCHEEDEFDFNTGAVIALTRAVKGVDNVEVCIKDEVEEPKETEWDKFKNGELTFKVYQKDIEKFLDVCTDDNIYWVSGVKANNASLLSQRWEEWCKYDSIWFEYTPNYGLSWDRMPLRKYKFTWNPSDPNHNPTKIKTYKGITIDGDTAYVKYEGEEIPFDIVKRNGNKLTLVSRNILGFMPFSVSNSNDYAKSDIKNFLHDKFVKRFEPEFINMLTCDGFYLMSGEEVKEYYPEREDKIKKYLSEPYWYWLRTPNLFDSDDVYVVYSVGNVNSCSAENIGGLVPACEVILES